MPKYGYWFLAVCLLILGGPATVALAHGDLESSTPAAGERLNAVPRMVSVTLSQAPSDAKLTVIDGCDRKVAKKSEISGDRVTARIKDTAQPGAWTLRYQAVSSVDDHITDDRVAFKVGGNRDCSQEEPSPSPSPTPAPTNSEEAAGPPSDDDAEQTSSSDDSEGIPAVGIVVGAGVIVAAGFGLRRFLAR